MTAERADIVIVNWNTGPLLSSCLASIEAHPEGVAQVIVIDNGSVDGSADLESTGTRARIVRTGENLGFAKACNKGAAYCTAPFILFLNPDARLLPGGLPNALALMAAPAENKVGIIGVQLLDDDGRVQITSSRFPTLWRYFGHALGLDRLLPKVFPPHFLLEFDHLTTRPVDIVMGAFYLVRARLFRDLGQFDERYFVYMEEVDFSLRAKQAGWLTCYLAGAQAYHLGGGSSDRVKAHRLFYVLRSETFYIFKHQGALAGLAFILMTLSAQFMSRLFIGLWRGELRNTLGAFGMYLARLPGIAATAIGLREADRAAADKVRLLAADLRAPMSGKRDMQ